jgi:hypothetical protein
MFYLINNILLEQGYEKLLCLNSTLKNFINHKNKYCSVHFNKLPVKEFRLIIIIKISKFKENLEFIQAIPICV